MQKSILKFLNKIVPVGTRSLIFGVHNVFYHPFTVYKAWLKLYGRPSLKETICIITHDWGYINCQNIDGEEGQNHPELAGRISRKLFGSKYEKLCLCHSRNYAKKISQQPSKLCYADKLSIAYETWWTYLPRAWLSGELKEYRLNSATSNLVPITVSNREWFHRIQAYYTEIVESAITDNNDTLNRQWGSVYGG